MGVVIRALHEPSGEDLQGLAALIERTTEHDRHRPIGEHAMIELKQGPRAFPHAAFAARDQAGEMVGYAHLSERETRSGWRLEAFVAPEHRGGGAGRDLLDAVLAHIREHGGGHIHAWAYRPEAPQMRLAERLGMTLTRRLFRMHRLLPAAASPVPEGITLRPFRAGDGPGWLALHNVVFAEHPDGGGWRESDLEWHLQEDWFDPEGFILAEDAQGLAGYCWMKREGPQGWVYFLGVHPRLRGTGLAAGLCTAGLAWAHEGRARRGALYVDETNRRAVRLYERLGFEVEHIDICFELDVAPEG